MQYVTCMVDVNAVYSMLPVWWMLFQYLTCVVDVNAV